MANKIKRELTCLKFDLYFMSNLQGSLHESPLCTRTPCFEAENATTAHTQKPSHQPPGELTLKFALLFGRERWACKLPCKLLIK